VLVRRKQADPWPAPAGAWSMRAGPALREGRCQMTNWPETPAAISGWKMRSMSPVRALIWSSVRQSHFAQSRVACVTLISPPLACSIIIHCHPKRNVTDRHFSIFLERACSLAGEPTGAVLARERRLLGRRSDRSAQRLAIPGPAASSTALLHFFLSSARKWSGALKPAGPLLTRSTAHHDWAVPT
jgi:hypothetical protein